MFANFYYVQEKEHNSIDFFAEGGPARTVVGVVGYPGEMECDVEPLKPDDQLQLVLWYKEGHASPIYT